MIHELKIKPEYFAAVVSGDKTFEIRNNADRNFKVGDTLLLWEWDEGLTSQTAERTVSYITDFEQKPGYVVLGLANKREQELAEQLADATRQCGVMAGLLRDSQRYVRYHLEHHECDARIVMGLISDIDTAMAGKLPAPTDGVTETIRTAPERIWLQVGDHAGDGDYQFPEHHDEVTWCADSVVACEVPYVRADLVGHSGHPLDMVPVGQQLIYIGEIEVSHKWWLNCKSEFFSPIDGADFSDWPDGINKLFRIAASPKQQGGEPCAIEPRSSSPA